MSRTAFVAVSLAAAGLIVFGTALALLFVPLRSGVANPYPAPVFVLMLALFLVTTPILGALVAVRQPGNPAGWLFLAMALLLGFGLLADSIARHLPASPAVGLFVCIGSDVGSFWTACLTLLTSLFPNGRLPSRRWRIVVALPLLSTAAQVTESLFDPTGGISPPIQGVTYPLARPDWRPLLDALGATAGFLLTAGLIGYAALLIVRWRRSRGIERQQLKLFMFAMMVVVGLLFTVLVVNQFNGDWGNAAWAMFQGSLILLPLSVAAAILRYRLFDIDLVIRRTLVYAALTGFLAAVYAVSVLALGELLGTATQGGSLAVAGSTLLVVALFQPARRRTQSLVDRRFDRARYDAARELEAFRLRLRGELDPERLSAEVAATAIRTMQPQSVSVWLRMPALPPVTVSERAVGKMRP